MEFKEVFLILGFYQLLSYVLNTLSGVECIDTGSLVYSGSIMICLWMLGVTIKKSKEKRKE